VASGKPKPHAKTRVSNILRMVSPLYCEGVLVVRRGAAGPLALPVYTIGSAPSNANRDIVRERTRATHWVPRFAKVW